MSKREQGIFGPKGGINVPMPDELEQRRKDREQAEKERIAKEKKDREDSERKESSDYADSLDTVDPEKNTLAKNMAKAMSESGSGEVTDKELESIAYKAPEEKATVESNIKKVLDTTADPQVDTENILDNIMKGNNYRKVMQELDSELETQEEAISKGLKDAKSDANMQELIRLGISAAATMYAASKGIKTKLSEPLPSTHAKRLEEIREEVDNRRRVLRSKINSARGLTKELYGQEERKQHREDSLEAQQERATERRIKARETKVTQQKKVDAARANNAENYERALSTSRQRFLDTWNKKKTTKEREAFIKARMPNIQEEKLKELSGRVDWWFDDEPKMEEVTIAAETVALQTVKTPRAQVDVIPRSERDIQETPAPEGTPSKKTTSGEITLAHAKKLENFIMLFADSTDPKKIQQIIKAKKLLGK